MVFPRPLFVCVALGVDGLVYIVAVHPVVIGSEPIEGALIRVLPYVRDHAFDVRSQPPVVYQVPVVHTIDDEAKNEDAEERLHDAAHEAHS